MKEKTMKDAVIRGTDHVRYGNQDHMADNRVVGDSLNAQERIKEHVGEDGKVFVLDNGAAIPASKAVLSHHHIHGDLDGEVRHIEQVIACLLDGSLFMDCGGNGRDTAWVVGVVEKALAKWAAGKWAGPFPRENKEWTPWELRMLVKADKTAIGILNLSRVLGRSPQAIETQAQWAHLPNSSAKAAMRKHGKKTELPVRRMAKGMGLMRVSNHGKRKAS